MRQRAQPVDTLAPDVVEADCCGYPEGTEDSGDPFGLWATNIKVYTSAAPEDCDPVTGTWPMRGLPRRVAKFH